MQLNDLTTKISSAIDDLDSGSNALEDLIGTSPEMMDEVQNMETNPFDEIERGTQKLNELQSKLNELTHKNIYLDVENKLMLNTNKKTYVCGGDDIKDELQLAYNEINEGLDAMANVLEALEELNTYIDEDIDNIIDMCRIAVEKTEVGTQSIETLLEESKKESD